MGKKKDKTFEILTKDQEKELQNMINGIFPSVILP